MLETVIIILMALWLVGVIGFGSTIGSMVHILLLVALGFFIFRLIIGRKTV